MGHRPSTRREGIASLSLDGLVRNADTLQSLPDRPHCHPCTPDRAPSTTTQCMYGVRILLEWGGDRAVGLVGETFSWTTVLCLEGQTVSWTAEVKPRKGNIFPAPLPLQGLEGQSVSWATSFTTGRANRFRGHSHIDWQGPSLFRCHVYLGHWGWRVKGGGRGGGHKGGGGGNGGDGVHCVSATSTSEV